MIFSARISGSRTAATRTAAAICLCLICMVSLLIQIPATAFAQNQDRFAAREYIESSSPLPGGGRVTRRSAPGLGIQTRISLDSIPNGPPLTQVNRDANTYLQSTTSTTISGTPAGAASNAPSSVQSSNAPRYSYPAGTPRAAWLTPAQQAAARTQSAPSGVTVRQSSYQSSALNSGSQSFNQPPQTPAQISGTQIEIPRHEAAHERAAQERAAQERAADHAGHDHAAIDPATDDRRVANAQYSNSQYSNAQYSNAQYSNAQYSNTQYQYPNTQYPNTQYATNGPQYQTAQNCNCGPANPGFQTPANLPPALNNPAPGTYQTQPLQTFQGPAVNYPGSNPGYQYQVPNTGQTFANGQGYYNGAGQVGNSFNNWFNPLAQGTGAYQPIIRLQNMPPGTYLGQGIIGQPTAYVDGQPVRNLLRYVSP